jgi:hypothetical protein
MNYFYIVLFVVGLYLLWKRENFSPNTNVSAKCPKGYENTPSGDCKLKTDVHDPR